MHHIFRLYPCQWFIVLKLNRQDVYKFTLYKLVILPTLICLWTCQLMNLPTCQLFQRSLRVNMKNTSYKTLSIPEKQLQKPFRRISDNIDFDFSSTTDGWNHAKNQVDVDLAIWFRIIALVFEKSKSKLRTRSSWPICALRGDEAVNSTGQQWLLLGGTESI